jgi:hypothetical protein
MRIINARSFNEMEAVPYTIHWNVSTSLDHSVLYGGICHFIFDAQGLVAKQVIERIIPPPKRWIGWLMSLWKGLFGYNVLPQLRGMVVRLYVAPQTSSVCILTLLAHAGASWHT